jgi:hypothetical protein
MFSVNLRDTSWQGNCDKLTCLADRYAHWCWLNPTQKRETCGTVSLLLSLISVIEEWEGERERERKNPVVLRAQVLWVPSSSSPIFPTVSGIFLIRLKGPNKVKSQGRWATVSRLLIAAWFFFAPNLNFLNKKKDEKISKGTKIDENWEDKRKRRKIDDGRLFGYQHHFESRSDNLWSA